MPFQNKNLRWFYLSFLLLFSACDVSPIITALLEEEEDDYPDYVYTGNSPVITEFTLTPETAYTNTDLTVNVTSTDYDSDDSLLTTFSWYVNNTLISSDTSTTLASSNFVKSDFVKVTVSVTDGTNTTSDSRSITIADAPPELSINGDANEITFGSTLTFKLSTIDPDGDSLPNDLSYSVVYAPNGMTIDSLGNVAWTPNQALFTTQTKFNWALAVKSNDVSSILKSSTTVIDNDRLTPLSKTALSVSPNPYTTYLGDLDNNGSNEILTIDADSNLYTLIYQTDRYIQDWVSSISPITDTQRITGIQALNTDNNIQKEIFLAVSSSNLSLNSSLIKLDGITRKVIANTPLSTSSIPAFLIDDIDNDSTKELILLVEDTEYNMFHIEVRHAQDLSLIWKSPSSNLGSHLHVDNIDNDSYKEIITSNGYVYGSNGTDIVNKWLYSNGFGNFLKTADMTGDGINEIIGYSSTELNITSAVSKSQISSLYSSNVYALSISNVDLDPEPEIITTSYNTYQIYSYDSATSTINEDHSSFLNYLASNIIIGDIDNDNEQEIAIINGYGARSFNVLSTTSGYPQEWQNSETFFYGGSYYGGGFYSIEQNNNQLVYIANMDDTNFSDTSLISLDITNDILTLSNSISLGENEHNLTAADVNSDGTDEFFITSSPSLSDSIFHTYNFITDFYPWSSPKNFGTLISSDSADINNDGHPDMIALIKTTSYYDSDSIHVYDTFNSTLLWSYSLNQNEIAVNINTKDLDNDGNFEIISATSNAITVFKKSGTNFIVDNTVTLNTNGTGIRDIEVTDIENDGNFKITSLSCGYDSITYDDICTINTYDKNLSQITSFTVPGTTREITYESFSSGRRNLLLNHSNFIYSRTSTFELIDAFTGDLIMKTPLLLGRASIDSVNYVDFDNNGIPEISYATNTSINVTR